VLGVLFLCCSGGRRTVAYLESSQLSFDDQARTKFRLLLAAAYTPDLQHLAPASNWLRLERSPPSALFLVRETFGDRGVERAMAVSITCVSPPSPPSGSSSSSSSPPTTATSAPSALTAEQLCAGLESTTLLVAGGSALFAKWARDFQQHDNTLPLFDQQVSDEAGGDPNIRYFHSYWRLPPGVALVVNVSPPAPCQSWNFQLNNHWMESLDYRYHRVHTNSVLATPNCCSKDPPAAGTEPSFTLIIARDCDCEGAEARSLRRDVNWLSTAGHDCGTM
jgi:hypothetical protein